MIIRVTWLDPIVLHAAKCLQNKLVMRAGYSSTDEFDGEIDCQFDIVNHHIELAAIHFRATLMINAVMTSKLLNTLRYLEGVASN